MVFAASAGEPSDGVFIAAPYNNPRPVEAIGERRTYRGPVEAVLFDWAGTTVDYGCLAPVAVFLEVFRRLGVPITMEEARLPMGAHKREHIRSITQFVAVRRRFQEILGREPTDRDVDDMFAAFVPLQIACLSTYSALIPGTLEVVGELRNRGIKIGSTTGYTTDMTAINLKDARHQGYEPDSTVCSDEVPAGRPFPHMCLQNAINLNVTTVTACIKVDDTIPGIAEGLNAGMWSIGLAVSGNEVGLSLNDWTALPKAEQDAKRARAYTRLHQSGAHYVIDTVADLLPCVADIQARIRRGETP